MKDEGRGVKKEFGQAIIKTKEQIVRYEELTGPVAPDNAIGRVSRMDAINNKSVVDAALRKARAKLAGLRRYQDQIGTSTFGRCPKCAKDIPIKRILLAPESAFCVNCAP